MSIVGQPHERHTVISSWEILDSPVPFRQPHRHHSPYHSPKHTSADPVSHSTDEERFVKSQRVTPINSESDNSSQHSDANFAEQEIHGEPITDSPGTLDLTGFVSPHESDSADRESDVHELIANTSTEDHRPAVNSVNRDVHREPQYFSSGAATYVSTQPRQADDIADTIAAEFEQHARRSQRSHRREYLENRAQLLHSEIIPEFSEIDQHSRHSEASQNSASQRTTIQYREDSVESTEMNEQLDQQSRDNTEIDRISHTSNAVSEPRDSSQFPNARNYSEVGVMSVSSAVSSRSELPSTVSNHGNEIEPISQQNNDRRHLNSGRVDSATNQSRQRRRESNQRNGTGEQASVRHRSANTDSNNTNNNEISPHNQTNQGEISHSDFNQPSTSSRDPSFEVTSRSVPDGGDFPPVRFGVEQDLNPSGPNIASPIFHPPPTIVQNGISQSDLLELMKKGLGNFTTEMAVLVIEKLKPEYETIAKKVGNEVKEATVSELKDLREKLRETEYKLESMSDERDLLKTENIKERDLIKREFEKDRLKRVKEFEEKNELINKLRAENEKLQNTLKDKDKYLKKAELKVKSEEAKRLKSEEESVKRLKDLQKELDKAKGEILVLKSKKRIQVSSAAKNRKEALLGKLNSNHGMYPRHFNGHLPYDEGDDG